MKKLGYLLICFFLVIGLTVSTIGCKKKAEEVTVAPTEEQAPAPEAPAPEAPAEEAPAPEAPAPGK
ncbi:MAG: hypothetical protein ABIJ37_06185 [Pseudomonadota bacterium]